MRIAMMSQYYRGGREIWLDKVTERLEKRNYEFIYPDGYKVTEASKMERLKFWFKTKPPEDCDIIHLHDFNLPSLRSGKPIVNTFHGSAMEMYKQTGNKFTRISAFMDKWRSRYGLNVVISRDCQRDIPNSIYVPNGTDTKLFSPNKHKDKFEFMRKEKRINVLFTGRNVPLKGRIDMDLIKVYDSTLNFIEPNEWIEHKEMPFLYNACDVYAHCSHYDGTALNVLEAMACGKPVVAWNIGGLSDCIFNDVNGYLVEMGEHAQFALAILRAYKNRKRLGINGRILCETIFNWKNVAQQYNEIYQKLGGR